MRGSLTALRSRATPQITPKLYPFRHRCDSRLFRYTREPIQTENSPPSGRIPAFLRLGQRESDDAAPRRRSVFPSAAHNHNILASFDFINRRRGVARRGKDGLPQQFPRQFVEGAKLLIEIRRPDE